MIVAGVVVAFIGHDTLRWAPPPAPPGWASGNRQLASKLLPHHGANHGLTRSPPVRIDIPSIGVHAKVIALGLTSSGQLAVPSLSTPQVTSWYDKGPYPGQAGAAAILGHVDAAKSGPAIFYKLGDLRPGAKIYVRLRNGRTAVFETYSTALYVKTSFPTRKVFGATSWPTLRLITCGGQFDRGTGHYLANVVAFASYVGMRR
jgi:hypothetical protein